MEEKQPFFSIIIATYGRPSQLEACLQSIARLHYPRDRFEVIVVDDGNKTPPEAVVSAFSDKLDIKLLTQVNAGPATARNTGVQNSQGEVLTFIDDDCTPAPDWLQTLALQLASKPDHAVGGRT